MVDDVQIYENIHGGIYYGGKAKKGEESLGQIINWSLTDYVRQKKLDAEAEEKRKKKEDARLHQQWLDIGAPTPEEV